ncbi:protease-4 [Ereboglobus sp. PH5-10]|uniref:signal peptide peptidase SppA n=1 Tax=Ereboglobus sp. PH5-10 TaxID=2940629 RepID=UPI0024054985|nr:signal peptide peptidase SppA [Ereboglobus sp. PH5-10]MDF9828264.1 protease-4 [Ereboglobus sp. PH5-10]
MKNFFTSLLGSLTALAIFSIGSVICGFMFFAVIGSMVGGGGDSRQVTVEKGAYLVFDMSVNITDAPAQMDSSALMGALAGGRNEPDRLQLRQVTNALKAAAEDSRIAGVFLCGGFEPDGYGTGYAALREVREALEQVRAAKKPVIAYLEQATVREMYVASLADELVLDPYGLVLMPGLASQPMYYAGAFEKFGVGVQVTRVGKYKSAIEPFTRTGMSPESREQMQKLLDDLWGDLRNDIAAGRGLRAQDLQVLVDREGFIQPEVALQRKLVTRLAYRDEVIDDLKTRTGREGSAEPFKQIGLQDYIFTLPRTTGPAIPPKTETAGKRGGGKGAVAIVYAEGAIVDGRGSAKDVGGERFARQIRRLRQDDKVKAIVLRVNSPGGSATASEHIQREIRLARKEKPVIVSMGAYAASGGYWIATYGDRIFAEPGTITGSIGVFGMQLDMQKLANNVGVTFDSVKTGKYADTRTIARPKTPDEMALYQRMVDWIYEEFVGKVAESRNIPKERVHEIAQGRVWSGAEALKLGLVDEIGGLDDAILYAVEKAGLGPNYRVQEFPRKKEMAEVLNEMLGGRFSPEQSDARVRAGNKGAVNELVSRIQDEAHILNEFNDPKGIYARLPLDLIVK